MAWKIELSAQVDRELGKLDPQQNKRILKFLRERVARLDNPRSIGQALQGSKLGEFWKYPSVITGSFAKLKTTGFSFWFYVSATVKKSTGDLASHRLQPLRRMRRPA
jgi:hypothetical protein